MVLKTVLSATMLFFAAGLLTSAIAVPLHEWEGDEGNFEDGAPRAFIDERNHNLEDIDAATDPNEVVEVAVAPKRRFAVAPRKDLALVPLPSMKGAHNIKDETQITGENAKKRLPSYVKQNQPPEPSFLHDIHQVTASFWPADLQRKAD